MRVALILLLALFGCKEARAQEEPRFERVWAALPQEADRKKILAQPQQFLQLLQKLHEQDRQRPLLSRLVDKRHPLPADYVPSDLTDLEGLAELTELTLARSGLKLRRILLPDLQRMSSAAKKEGIILAIASSYRSYSYQENIFRRYAQRDGREQAERYSAQAGQSQHQLGLTIDFAPIAQSFAQTAAYRWLEEHALEYGFSLSYPQGKEARTGYIYEPWHYRYIGPLIAEILTRYFHGYQQVFLEFWQQNRKLLQEAPAP